jgi:hypothetical protein
MICLLPSLSSKPRATGRLPSNLVSPMLWLAPRWAGVRVPREMIWALCEDRGDLSEQLQSPAAHHTLASTQCRGTLHCSGRAARVPHTPQSPGLREGKCKSALAACFPQKESFQYACLVLSAFTANAHFIFAFYEPERGNSFPWYIMILWRKSCPNTFCSQMQFSKKGCSEMRQKRMITSDL